jgi:hypothetical protein
LKSWRPLFHFLLDITIVNCYKLSARSVPGHWPKRSAHKAFREDLVEALFNCGERLTKPPGRVAIMEEKDIYKAPAGEHGQEPVWIFSKQPSYAACVTARRGSIIEKKARWKPLMELLVNTTQKSRDSKEWARRQRPPRT